MRTLVVSDLHLGSRARHDVLRWPVGRERLLAALDGVDRLVLLGDTMELMTRNRQRTLAIAEPVMRAIGAQLGSDREVVVVPGNHDAPLARPWALAQGRDLRPATPLAPDATPLLARLLSWLSPARVSVSYPGVWLDERVWATHGQYLDRHLMPESAFGLQRGRLRGVPRGGAVPFDYERPPRRRGGGGRGLGRGGGGGPGRGAGGGGGRDRGLGQESGLSRVMARPVASALEGAAELVRVATMPHLPRLLKSSGLAPVTAALIDAQMRHAAVPAMARVVRRLGVDADWVLFGHVHRRGPLGDERWPQDDGTRFANTGAWVYDPVLVDRATPPHPYWPGGAILLEDGREPRSVGLLDDVAPADLVPLPGRGTRRSR